LGWVNFFVYQFILAELSSQGGEKFVFTL